jgi:Tfp pilus assembly ATPase PilU
MEIDKSEEQRNSIISQLSLSKQFILRQHLTTADKLSREQAIEMLKESLVSSAFQEHVFNNIIKTQY